MAGGASTIYGETWQLDIDNCILCCYHGNLIELKYLGHVGRSISSVEQTELIAPTA